MGSGEAAEDGVGAFLQAPAAIPPQGVKTKLEDFRKCYEVGGGEGAICEEIVRFHRGSTLKHKGRPENPVMSRDLIPCQKFQKKGVFYFRDIFSVSSMTVKSVRSPAHVQPWY